MEGGRGGEVKGDRKGGEWERGFFLGGGLLSLLNLADKESCFRGGALEAC